MQVPYYTCNAFADTLFSGNPAGVCLLEEDISPSLMQTVASELRLSETCFIVPKGDHFGLRWFTPTNEVSLCGHGTLAAAHVLWHESGYIGERIVFETMSGELIVRQKEIGEIIVNELEFPRYDVEMVHLDDDVLQFVGDAFQFDHHRIIDCYYEALSGKLFLRFDNVDSIINAQYNEQKLLDVPFPIKVRGVNLTTMNTENTSYASYDYLYRYFSPWNGIAEDPVNGSSNTMSAPLYHSLTSKTNFSIFCASPRSGTLFASLSPHKTFLSGQCRTFISGTINLKDKK